MKMTTVKKGSKGDAVKQLQMLLVITADGKVLLWNRIGAALGTSEVISLSAVFPAD